MRIKNFEINGYGPLMDTGKISMGDFNLLYGNNENGKTLTIDALIKFLLGKRAKDFTQVDRVDSDPKGHLTLAFSGGIAEKVLPIDGDFLKITKEMPTALNSADFRNIFIIRNSELSIANETKFYTGITEKLVGLRTSDIKKIRKNLLDIGSLTDNLNFKDDEKTSKLKSRLNFAVGLLENINELKEKLLNEKYDKLEMALYKKNEGLSGVIAAIREYEDALSREKYERSSELLNDLKKRISELRNLEIFNDDDYQTWQEGEREIKRIDREIGDLKEKRERVYTETKEIDERAKELGHKLNTTERKKGLLDNERLKISGIKDAVTKAVSSASLIQLLNRFSILSSIITVTMMAIAWFVENLSYFSWIGLILLGITIVLWSIGLVLAIQEKRTKKEFEDIRLSIAELGLKANTIEEMLSLIREFDDDYEGRIRKLGEYKSLIDSKRRETDEIDKNISNFKEAIENEEKRIVQIMSESGIKNLDEYRAILQTKIEKEKQRDSISSKLEGILDIHGRSLGENINLLEAKIQELESYKNKGKGINFNRNKYTALRERRIALEEELEALKQKMDTIGTEMSNVERRVNEFIRPGDERLYCKTLTDLEAITKRLNIFIDKNNKRRDEAKEAIAILNEIEMDERGKILELFDKDANVSVSGIFNQVTGGLYDEVIYDSEDERIKAMRSSGELIDADKLSGGAYDQLYLAIRIALGERLLKTEKGFFIMDDPFIKSDIHRIERQMEALKKIAQDGWQILYFSAKKEIKDVLMDDINKDKINYVEIKWLDEDRSYHE